MAKPRFQNQVHFRGHGVPARVAAQSGGSFVCPACGHGKTSVYDSRPTRGSVRRTRACLGCGHRFVTWECEGAAPDIANVAARRVIAELRSVADRIERLFLHIDTDKEAAD